MVANEHERPTPTVQSETWRDKSLW